MWHTIRNIWGRPGISVQSFKVPRHTDGFGTDDRDLYKVSLFQTATYCTAQHSNALFSYLIGSLVSLSLSESVCEIASWSDSSVDSSSIATGRDWMKTMRRSINDIPMTYWSTKMSQRVTTLESCQTKMDKHMWVTKFHGQHDIPDLMDRAVRFWHERRFVYTPIAKAPFSCQWEVRY